MNLKSLMAVKFLANMNTIVGRYDILELFATCFDSENIVCSNIIITIIIIIFYDATAQYLALGYRSSRLETCDVLQGQVVSLSPNPNM